MLNEKFTHTNNINGYANERSKDQANEQINGECKSDGSAEAKSATV